MNDETQNQDHGIPAHHGVQRGDDAAEKAERAAQERRDAERERAESRPFDYPYPERRANVRARRHISKEEADADMPPGVGGSYGTTGGGQPGGTGVGNPPRHQD
ncbi:hypothetical protein [Streptomyces minutiscleroticus]|uniref:Uncharacterized protein n=1 Tax=Streptomyces minutiscleroticus TaxID=68238 RepID=A0A918U8F3_9ACTN|nr:hypothetical protein [Streptomyces minutiscleroticus]GGY11238.1 hypothetical protein GCM10010358_74600 [Streptomyces minutiscleroticus]